MSTLNAEFGSGPIFQLSYGSHRELFVRTHELANELFDEKRFSRIAYGALNKLRPVGGNGLFLAQNGDPDWGLAHRILMPVFGPLKIRDMFDGMNDIAEQLRLKWCVKPASQASSGRFEDPKIDHVF